MVVALTIIGALFVLYGLKIMLLWSGTWFFAVWYVLGIVCFAFAGAIHSGAWSCVPDLVRRVTYGVIGVLVAGIVVFSGMSLSCFGAKGDPGLDCLIVLGAQVRDDQPSTVLKYRLDTACDYLRENERTKCIVSGGKGSNEAKSEAEVMAEYLKRCGIDPARIVLEAQSQTTSENIENSLALIDPAKDAVGIVTNDFHVYRATGIARKKGIANVCGIAAPSTPDTLPNNMLREAFSIAKDYVTGNL